MDIVMLNQKFLESGMTKRELAKRSGLSRVTIDCVLRGDNINIRTMERICNAIMVSPASLFGDSAAERGYRARIEDLESRLQKTQGQVEILLKMLDGNKKMDNDENESH